MKPQAVDRRQGTPRRHAAERCRLLTLVVVVYVVQGCATHRGRPPECKGPYTPINQSWVASSDGAQR